MICGSCKPLGVAVAFITLAGCGGSSGGGGSVPQTLSPPPGPIPPLSLVLSTPASGAVVGCGIAPVLDFSGNLDASTVTASSVTLTSGSITQATTLSVSDAQLTVTPNPKLTAFLPYTLTAGTAVKGEKGEVLANPASISFTCDGAWQTAAAIDTDTSGDAGTPTVAFDASGNAIAVWNQFDGVNGTIWWSRFTPANRWGTPAQLQSSTESSNVPAISVDSNGDALVVWDATPDGANTYVYASRFSGGAWSPEVQISGPTVSQGTVDIAGDPSGDALVTWQQLDGPRLNIWGAHYSAANGWAAAAIASNGAGNARSSRLAMDTNGNALAVWVQTDGTQYNVWSSRYDAATGFGTAALVEAADAGSAAFPRIKFDGNGNAIAVWSQSDGTESNVWASRYVAETGWNMPVLIEPAEAGDASLPRLDVNAAGDAVVAWAQSNGTRVSIWANTYSVATGWGTEVMIEPPPAADASEPWVAIDSRGNALTLWRQSDGTLDSVWANRYLNGTWLAAQAIEPVPNGDAGAVSVAMDSKGTALAIWEVDAAHAHIWVNRFD